MAKEQSGKKTSNPEEPSVNGGFHPDDYRMTLGEHLEELRTRLFFALIGYAIVLVACFFYGDVVVAAFCDPLVQVLEKKNINPQLVMDEAGEGFMVYIEISMITAGALASPWIVYQIWQFVAAGLFPHERKYITKFLPLSIGLLLAGMAFVYFLVLPWTLEFLIGFGGDIRSLRRNNEPVPVVVDGPTGLLNAKPINGNPPKAANGDVWYDTNRGQLKIFYNGAVRVISFNSENLLAAEIKLSTYIDTVVTSLLVFGLSFQLPLVVLAIERIGIVELDALRKGRKMVYFALCIIAAIITPGGDIPSLLGLTIPLCGLYELGIWLARNRPKDADAAAA
ncbi:MAG TPA: twin-arginine translocase subunit TatC [Humisphaera sp.]